MCKMKELNKDRGFQTGFHGTLGIQEDVRVRAGHEGKKALVERWRALPPYSVLSTGVPLQIALKQRVLLLKKEKEKFVKHQPRCS